MLDLIDELVKIIQAFDRRQVAYAVCGGLALAVHGIPRATIDIDLLIRPESEATAREVVAPLGYTLQAEPMSFAEGAVQVRRVSRLDHPKSEEVLMLDLLLVTPQLEDVWASRQRLEWDFGDIWVVDRTGLIKLKLLRGSPQDQQDVERLSDQEQSDEA